MKIDKMGAPYFYSFHAGDRIRVQIEEWQAESLEEQEEVGKYGYLQIAGVPLRLMVAPKNLKKARKMLNSEMKWLVRVC